MPNHDDVTKAAHDVVAKTLTKNGFTSHQIETVFKALPSQPVWYSTTADWGFWDGDRGELLKLLAFYQKNPIVHGAIDINAKGITAAKPTLMKIVNKGAKNLFSRGLKSCLLYTSDAADDLLCV